MLRRGQKVRWVAAPYREGPDSKAVCVVQSHRFHRAIGALLAVLGMGMGCSGDDSEAAKTMTTTTMRPTTTTSGPLPCDFKLGDRITADVVGRPCVMTFDCADLRIHVIADLGDGKRLEGFAPTDQSGNPRPDTSDAAWQEYGGEYQNFGRTKLQFDCGG